MATFVVCHDAWTSGSTWRKVGAALAARGHEAIAPTLTGLGERAHLATPDVDLDLHVRDLLGLLECADLSDVTLVGHGYGGMVCTGVADRARARIARIVYVDGWVPTDGASLLDLAPEAYRLDARRSAAADPGCRIAPPSLPDGLTDAERATIVAAAAAQPLHTFEQPIRLRGDAPGPSWVYVRGTRTGSSHPCARFADAARRDAGWLYGELDAGDHPQVTAPDALARLLATLVD